MEDDLRRLFGECEFSEHAEQDLKRILNVAADEADLTPDEWQTVFESLATDVEFGEARWLD